MKKAISNEQTQATEPAVQASVHPLQKSYMFISSKHVEYNNLSAFESVTMSLALVLAVTLGVAMFAA